MHCNAAQDAVPTHDAMIASSGTGTAGPLMGTMHSLLLRSETKDKKERIDAEQRIINGNTGLCDSRGKHIRSGSKAKGTHSRKRQGKETEFVTNRPRMDLAVYNR